MSSLTLFAGLLPARTDAPVRPAPPRRPQGPVLIGDSVTCADHATLLLALWRRAEAERDGA